MKNGGTKSENKQLQLQPPSTAMQVQAPPQILPTPTWKLILVAAIAAGIQFGWALQLSLLTPYVQLLGIPHKWAAFIWLCGPISGMLVQPIVGYYSDRCQSSFGRRRPYIASGAGCVTIAIILIGFAADIGYKAGDDMTKKLKPRAVTVFVIGFWILDVANNMLQGPCRALLADLCNSDTRRMRSANAFYSFFMAVGNVLGYAAGSYKDLYKVFPFSKTHACDLYCANLKSCFIISIALLISITIVALTLVREKQWKPEDAVVEPPSAGKIPVFGELFGALKDLPRPMLILLLVTCLNWIAWFPFILFDTDWMGREIYGGDANKGKLYDQGVRAGSLGLLLNSVVLGLTSIAVEYLVRGVGGVKILWGAVNFVLSIGLVMTVVVSKVAEHQRRYGSNGQPLPPSAGVKAGALSLFSVLGIPLSITYSIPFALASIYSSGSGAGQGLSLGVLNLAIVVPQMIVSVLAGPFDSLFGGGNLPAFIVGAVSAAVSGVLAIVMLPKPSKDDATKLTLSGSYH